MDSEISRVRKFFSTKKGKSGVKIKPQRHREHSKQIKQRKKRFASISSEEPEDL